MNVAFNAPAGGERVEHLRLRRDEVHRYSIRAKAHPRPNNCRRLQLAFCGVRVMAKVDAITKSRRRVWSELHLEPAIAGGIIGNVVVRCNS